MEGEVKRKPKRSFGSREKHVSQNCAERNLSFLEEKDSTVTFGRRMWELQLEGGRVRLSQEN